jgi:hypothetical protein
MAEPIPGSSDLTQPISIPPDQDPVIKEQPPSTPQREATISHFPLSPQSLLRPDSESQGEVHVHDGPMWNKDAITDGQIYHLMNTRRPNSEKGIVQADAPDAANDFDLEGDLLRSLVESDQNSSNQDETQKPKKKRRSPAKTAEEAHRRKYEHEATKKKRKLSPTSNTSLFNNLTNQDVFAAYEAAPDHDEAPEITATTKKKQLDQLLDNSVNYDMHKCKTNKSTLNDASKRFGLKQMSVDKGRWLLRGMNTCKSFSPFQYLETLLMNFTALYHHQLIGADWMLAREFSPNGPFGGICAEAMVRSMFHLLFLLGCLI